MVLDHCLYVVKSWLDRCRVHAHDVGAIGLYLCYFAPAPFDPYFHRYRGTGGGLYVPNARGIFPQKCALKNYLISDKFYFIDICNWRVTHGKEKIRCTHHGNY